MINQKPEQFGLLSGKIRFLYLILVMLIFPSLRSHAQCFSSANPVGGTTNLLVLDKKTLRTISFYRHAYSNKYFEGHSRSEFDQVKQANYNYMGWIFAYGFSQKFTLETEGGLFFNKSYHYNLDPVYILTGSGLNNMVISGKFRLVTDYQKRFFLTGSAGIKLPPSLDPQEKDGVVLPVDLQPSTNAFGSVLQAFLVKENSLSGMRYFLLSRFEMNLPGRNDYLPGKALISSVFVSKHLPEHWLPGDWTMVLQLRNEIRSRNSMNGIPEASTGGFLFLVSPQINYSIKEKWNLSVMADIPFYQYFNGTQLAYAYAFTVNFARDFNFYMLSQD